MGQELHVERRDPQTGRRTPIGLDEWKAALAGTDGVRLSKSTGGVARNPITGDVIRIKGRDGDAEVAFPGDVWQRVFSWRGASASFPFEPSFDEPDDPVRRAAFALAAALDAAVFGDEGERVGP